MNLTANQWLAIVLVVLGVLVASTAQLTDLFGPAITKTIVSVAGILVAILNGVIAVLTGQASQVKFVQDMPGVDKIVVNKKANTTLAQLAVDPAQDKIEAAPEAASAVAATARQG